VHLGPWFVVSKNFEENTIFITNDVSMIEKPTSVFFVNNLNWILNEEPVNIRCENGFYHYY
jgi:tRNA U34 2-thiouridine synthase MnmA/TrmU